MRLGYIVFAVLFLITYAILYAAIGNGFLWVSGGVATFIIFGLCWVYIHEAVVRFGDNLFWKARPAPALPLTLYQPDGLSAISGIVLGILFSVLLYVVIQNNPASVNGWYYFGIAFFILGGPSLICISLWRIRRKLKVMTLEEAGISANFFNLVGSRNFIRWNEIETIRNEIGWYARAPQRIISINTKDGGYYRLQGNLHQSHMKELNSWFDEYLSRYGSGAKPAA